MTWLSFSGDPYLNNALNALVEIFAYICMFFAVVFGRRLILVVGFIASGLCCIAAMLCDWYADGREGILKLIYCFSYI